MVLYSWIFKTKCAQAVVSNLGEGHQSYFMSYFQSCLGGITSWYFAIKRYCDYHKVQNFTFTPILGIYWPRTISGWEPSKEVYFHNLSTVLRPRQTRTHCCGHNVADTNVSPFALARNICCGHKFCVRDTKSFWFCSEKFCVRNKCFPVCAAQETSWATMCPQQCVLVCQGLYSKM